MEDTGRHLGFRRVRPTAFCQELRSALKADFGPPPSKSPSKPEGSSFSEFLAGSGGQRFGFEEGNDSRNFDFSAGTIRFQVLYVLLVLAHDRRRIVHFNVTAHPTAEWTAQQLREAFSFEQIPRYLLRDHDRIFGSEFRKDVKAMGIKEVLSAPRSPWQSAYVERVIGTIRRECLDHAIVLNEASLYRHVKSFLAYYHESRTHLSLAKDPPDPRPVHPPELGAVVAIPQVGGLHHRYERRAA
jgi:transposase InsO family protein